MLMATDLSEYSIETLEAALLILKGQKEAENDT